MLAQPSQSTLSVAEYFLEATSSLLRMAGPVLETLIAFLRVQFAILA
jgi:hypothetical protein